MLEDIAVLIAGTMIAEDLGIKLENVTLQMLGKAQRVRQRRDRNGRMCWTPILRSAGGSNRGVRISSAEIAISIVLEFR